MTSLKDPIIVAAFDRKELAELRAGDVPGMVAVVLDRFRAHGTPEEVCDAYAPSLTAALGAWWDEHFTCTRDMEAAGKLPKKPEG